jgi:hypothetical protein
MLGLQNLTLENEGESGFGYGVNTFNGPDSFNIDDENFNYINSADNTAHLANESLEIVARSSASNHR